MPAPVQIFFHGGGWRSMSKEEFGYVARSFHRKGAITLVPNYALLPDTTLDEMVLQCRAAVAWAWNNVHRYGGDRTRIFISGHSAGAHLVSMLATTDWTAYENCWPNIVKGVTAISGFYELEAARHSFVFRPFLKADEVARNSPFGKQVGVRTPFIISLGAHESRETHRQSRLYADYLAEIGMPSEHIVVEGHNHYSVTRTIRWAKQSAGKWAWAEADWGALSRTCFRALRARP
jgi:arylformamidase